MSDSINESLIARHELAQMIHDVASISHSSLKTVVWLLIDKPIDSHCKCTVQIILILNFYCSNWRRDRLIYAMNTSFGAIAQVIVCAKAGQLRALAEATWVWAGAE